MNDLELANDMIFNLDMFAAHPDWKETVNMFRPMIEEIMEAEKCNAMKASIPYLQKLQNDGDIVGGKMLMAVVTEMMLENVKN